MFKLERLKNKIKQTAERHTIGGKQRESKITYFSKRILCLLFIANVTLNVHNQMFRFTCPR